MTINNGCVVVDNDFLSHILEIRDAKSEIFGMLKQVFEGLSLLAVIHPLIYINEVQKNKPLVCEVFDKEIITVPELSDIHNNDNNKIAYYVFLINELSKRLNGAPLSLTTANVFTCWISQSNLGELHSVTMCLVCGCAIFLSDDADSAKLEAIIKSSCIGNISVYNRKAVCGELQKNGIDWNRSKRQSFIHER